MVSIFSAVHVSSHAFHDNQVGGTNGSASVRFCICHDEFGFYVTDDDYNPVAPSRFTSHDSAFIFAIGFLNVQPLLDRVNPPVPVRKPVHDMTDSEILSELTTPVVWTLDVGRMLCADGAPMCYLSGPQSRYVPPTALDDIARHVVELLNKESAQ